MPNLLRTIHRTLGIKYRVDRCIHYVKRFGVRGAIAAHRRIWSKTGGVREVEIPGLPYPVSMRPGTADASTLEKIFVWNDYELDYPEDVKTVVDAGANIGLSAVFFALRFPQATVVAIEPESENFRLLQLNTRHYPQVLPLRAALWSEDTELGLSNPDDRVDSYQYRPDATQQTVSAFALPSILARFRFSNADVLKIDIEGGETNVFAVKPGWVDRVRMFIIELHSPEARAAFTGATAALNATRYRHGEDEIVKVR
jgi:FkbM family methyltransferase